MTRLQKVVRRVTNVEQYELGKSRPIVVSVEPPGLLGFRLLGTRRTYRLPVGACFMLAVRAEADDKRRAKAAERKARKEKRA